MQFPGVQDRDLLMIKSLHPGSLVRHSDITPRVRQNCDATSRVLTAKVVSELKEYVPGSTATQLYLLAATHIHEPYRNANFGSPPMVVHSLWMGLAKVETLCTARAKFKVRFAFYPKPLHDCRVIGACWHLPSTGSIIIYVFIISQYLNFLSEIVETEV